MALLSTRGRTDDVDTRILILSILIVLLILSMVPRGVLGTSAGKANTLSFFVLSGGEFLRAPRPLLRASGSPLSILSLPFRLGFRTRRVGSILRRVRLRRRRICSLRWRLILILGFPSYTRILLVMLNLFPYASSKR